jgi:hypothetical protein
MISPDGDSYVLEGTTNIEIADSRTGAILHSIAPDPGLAAALGREGAALTVAGWTSAGIYLIAGGKGAVYGLWRVDPTTGVVTLVPGSAIRAGWSLVDESAAWASVFNSDNSTSVLRLNLSDGDVRTVYTTPSNQWAELMGSAGSGLFALVNARYVISASVIGADGTAVTVSLPPGLVGTQTTLASIQDGRSILFSGTQGLFAYDPIHGVRVLVADGRDFLPLGRCKS